MPVKLRCDVCNSEIIEYYNDEYKGKRGKCVQCSIDFPLE